jgi:hypothetical protein
MSAYEERYVAFIDILGFRELIGSLGKGMPYQVILELLREVHEPPRLDTPTSAVDGAKIASGGFRAQSISDAVVLSADLEPWGLYHLCYSISQLAITLLERTIFIRGAITKGMLYHDDKTVFGPGLVRAYDFESKIARFPSVIVSRDIVHDIEMAKLNFPWTENFKDILMRAQDGPLYLNVLDRIATELNGMVGRLPHELRTDPRYGAIELLRDNIQIKFDGSTDDPKIFEKIQWFAAYWNEVMPGHIMPPILGPGVASGTFQ